MYGLRKSLKTSALAAVLVAGTLVSTVGVASADVVCNSNGECWQTKERYAVTVYPKELGAQVYDNDWRKSHESDPKYKWMKDRDDDHGYYSQGDWHAFKQ